VKGKQKGKKKNKEKVKEKTVLEQYLEDLKFGNEPLPIVGDNQTIIPVHVYKPYGYDPDVKLPVLIWYHGGGLVCAGVHLLVYEMICRKLANKINCIVCSIGYRKAPEFKFPHGVEDAYTGLQWVYDNAELLHADVSRITLAGDSAGGSLSTLISLMSKLRNGPPITHQVLIYPCTDDPCTDEYPSQVDYQNGPIITRELMSWMLEQVVPEGYDVPDYLFPVRLPTELLTGLPPATIINGYHDPLRDQGTAYSKKLREAGVETIHTIYGSGVHGFFGSSVAESDEALLEVVYNVRKAFYPQLADELSVISKKKRVRTLPSFTLSSLKLAKLSSSEALFSSLEKGHQDLLIKEEAEQRKQRFKFYVDQIKSTNNSSLDDAIPISASNNEEENKANKEEDEERVRLDSSSSIELYSALEKGHEDLLLDSPYPLLPLDYPPPIVVSSSDPLLQLSSSPPSDQIGLQYLHLGDKEKEKLATSSSDLLFHMLEKGHEDMQQATQN